MNVTLNLSVDTVNLVLMGLQHISQAAILDIQQQAKASVDAQTAKEGAPTALSGRAARRQQAAQQQAPVQAVAAQPVGPNGAMPEPEAAQDPLLS